MSLLENLSLLKELIIKFRLTILKLRFFREIIVNTTLNKTHNIHYECLQGFP